MDHNEIKQQLKGEAASTFAYVNPEFGCPLRTQISGAFSSVEMMTAKVWADTVRALSALSLRKPRIHTSRSKREEEAEGEAEGDLCPLCFHD